MGERALTPALLALFAAVLWGIWWIPIRFLETLGMDGAWGSVAMNAGAALAALGWMALTRTPPRIGRRAFIGAALVGVAVATYSIALTMGDIVRIVLLFYLAPAWSKIIEWAFLGRGWHWTSTVTLLASLAGAFLVLGGQISLAALGPGDVLALSSGVAWAIGATFIFTGDRVNPLSLTFVAALCACLIGVGFAWLGAGSLFPGNASWTGTLAGAGFGITYVLPILALTLWSAQRLSPAVITFLLTAEILSGVGSAAWLLDEPFGVMQAGGTGLILLAAMAEVLASLRPSRV